MPFPVLYHSRPSCAAAHGLPDHKPLPRRFADLRVGCYASPGGYARSGRETMAIFTHVAVGTTDLAKARQFYDAVLAPLGYRRIKDLGDRGSCWGAEAEEFIV